MTIKGSKTVSLHEVVDLQNYKTSMADITGMAQKSHKATARITLVVHTTMTTLVDLLHEGLRKSGTR